MPTIEKLIKDNDPRIRNDLLLILGNQNYESVSTLEGKEDAARSAASRPCARSSRRSGGEPEKVEALYFTSFVMQ